MEKDLATLPEPELRLIRGGDIAMIFQEPMTSLNPVFTIGNQLMEAIRLHTDLRGGQLKVMPSKCWKRSVSPS